MSEPRMFYARATRWLRGAHLERRIALLAFVCALPSLGMGLHADDFFLRQNLSERGPFAAYEFVSRDADVAHASLLDDRADGLAPWWAAEHPRASFFRPLSSLTLWLDLGHGAPPWWMHLQNCAIYAVIVWLVIALYRQLGLTDASLGWAALFFALDGTLAQSIGWISGRDTLLGACFGFATLLAHDRARRANRPVLLAASAAFFALALLSAELGLCTLGYLAAHALTIDRGSPKQRVLVLVPYGLVTSVHLAHYLTAGYGFSDGGIYRDVLSSPATALSAWMESVPVWLATTATLPVATFRLMAPDLRVPLLVFSLVALGLVLPWLGSRSIREPHGRMFAIGAVLSVLPLAATLPQERLQFFVAFGVFGLLGPAVASDFDAPARARRWMTRVVWGLHGVLMPLLFVPYLVGIAAMSAPVHALDEALPHATSPTTILLNPPGWGLQWLVADWRASTNEPVPPVYSLYAGSQPLEVERIDDRTLELYVARGWSVTPFEAHVRNFAREPFHVGDRVDLPQFDVEVREVDEIGAPTRARFTFDRSLEDRDLAFLHWVGPQIEPWTPPRVGARVELAPTGPF